jgi:hypothetical protein
MKTLSKEFAVRFHALAIHMVQQREEGGSDAELHKFGDILGDDRQK